MLAKEEGCATEESGRSGRQPLLVIENDLTALHTKRVRRFVKDYQFGETILDFF